MFTGIVQDVGRIAQREDAPGGDLRLVVEPAQLPPARLAPGDSLAVSGVCLTVVQHIGRGLALDVSRETLAVTTLGGLVAGDAVNLEPALRAGDALGGHWVSGHVDGIAEAIELREDARSLRVRLRAPAALARYIATKGSVTLDGVSLTVNEVADDQFTVNLIPHTLQVTTLGRLAAGARLNLEIDALARYVERILSAGRGSQESER